MHVTWCSSEAVIVTLLAEATCFLGCLETSPEVYSRKGTKYLFLHSLYGVVLVVQAFGSVPLQEAQLENRTNVQGGPREPAPRCDGGGLHNGEDLKCSTQAKHDFNSRQSHGFNAKLGGQGLLILLTFPLNSIIFQSH